MKRSLAIIAVSTVFLSSAALAQSTGEKTGVNSALGIAPKTAGNHIERIYAKIGVNSRAEAAMFAMQNGLLPSWETAEN